MGANYMDPSNQYWNLCLIYAPTDSCLNGCSSLAMRVLVVPLHHSFFIHFSYVTYKIMAKYFNAHTNSLQNHCNTFIIDFITIVFFIK